MAGVVVSVQPSRKLPWLRLGRIRYAGAWLEALHGDRSVDPVVTLRGALRDADRRLARLSVHAYCLDEAQLGALEGRMATAGWSAEASERDYVRTSLVSLAGDEAALMERLSSSARYGIRSAERRGWRVERVRSSDAAPRLQALHELAFDRTGKAAVSVNLAGAIVASEADPSGSIVLGVYHPGRTGLNALVGFAHGVVAGDSVVYSTAGTERAPDIGSAPLGYGLVWGMMRWGQQQGLPWFDFGGITPEDQPEHPLARISEFKRKFRGREVRNGSDWFVDLRPVQSALLVAAGRAASLLRR